MNKTVMWLIAGFLGFLSCVVLWEIVAGIRYESSMEDRVNLQKAIDRYVDREERTSDEIEKDIRDKGNPYSLFR